MKGFSSKQGKPFVHYRIMKDIKRKNKDASRSKKIELT